jgi:hypothetical protein
MLQGPIQRVPPKKQPNAKVDSAHRTSMVPHLRRYHHWRWTTKPFVLRDPLGSAY